MKLQLCIKRKTLALHFIALPQINNKQFLLFIYLACDETKQTANISEPHKNTTEQTQSEEHDCPYDHNIPQQHRDQNTSRLWILKTLTAAHGRNLFSSNCFRNFPFGYSQSLLERSQWTRRPSWNSPRLLLP